MKINEKIEKGYTIAVPRLILRFMTSSPVFRVRSHHTLKQYLRVMKLTILIMTVFLLQVSALTKAQISLKEERTTLQKVLKSISKQSGYDFVYSNTAFKDLKPVTVNLNNVSIEAALKAAFENQPLVYEVADKTVMVKRKEDGAATEKVKDRFSAIEVRGRVLDEAGQVLNGATVKVKGTNLSVNTDEKGGFYLQNVAEEAVLEISFIGYVTQEVPVSKNMMLVRLIVATNSLDQVQVIAYGQTTKRLSTGNTVSVKAEDIAKSPVSNALLALQGRVPGITITQETGLPNGRITVRIQGQNSIGNGNEPFYVIDGVPYSSTSVQSISTVLVQSSPLSFLNPDNIESIDILKDADATAIYGSKAANGAILITTKKGKTGQTTIDLNMQQGIGQVARRLELLDTEQYLKMRMDAKKFTNTSLLTTDYDLNGTWDKNRYTDWQEELIGGTAHFTNALVNISGGSTSTQFLIGAGYNRQSTVFPGELADRKASLQFSINHTSENRKFKALLSGNYMDDFNNLTNFDFTGQAITLAPNAPSLYNQNGELNWQPLPNGDSTWENPFFNLLKLFKSTTRNLVSNSIVSYLPLNGLELKTTFGYNRLQTDENTTRPYSSLPPESKARGTLGSAGFANSSINTWIIEPQVSYRLDKPIGRFDFLLGSTFQQTNTYNEAFNATNYSNDFQIENIGSAGNVIVSQSGAVNYKYNALFGRINYNYHDKYLLNLTARRDGSSRFGSENLFENFYAMGIAWLFSNEEFFKRLSNVISYGKLKFSYGTTGNDQIGDYQFLSLYSSVTAAVPYQAVVGLSPNRFSNPFLQWELTRKINFGLDLAFLNDRIFLNVNYYRNRSGNQLLGYSLPIFTGFNSVASNFPATVQNSGLEVILDGQLIKSQNFNWKASFNISRSKNKLVAFPGLADNTSYRNIMTIGEPLSYARVYKMAGVNPMTGNYQFVNYLGQLVETPNSQTDLTEHIDLLPKFYGGFQNVLSFKKFELSFLFQFVNQIKKSYVLGNLPGAVGRNQPVTVLDYWEKSGDVTKIQKPLIGNVVAYNNATGSDFSYTTGSFIRLKNVSLSYMLPNTLVAKAGLKALRVFFQGQNLVTFTDYVGLDPESANALPPLRVFTAGLQLTL